MERLTQPRLAQGDLVIRPDLKGFSETDYRRSEALVRLGYGAF